jgi:hypothetical protein
MSPMSKTLLKLILTVLAVYLVVAAVPIVQQVYHGLLFLPPASAAPGSPAPLVDQVTPEPGAPAAAGDTPTTETAQAPAANPEGSPAAPEAVAPAENNNPLDNPPHIYLLFPILRSVEGHTYKVQDGTPILIQNFAHEYAACSWMSVAGQVLDANGEAVKNLVVVVTGTIGGKPVEMMGLTGMAQEYGPGGYEIQLSTAPVASVGQLTIQVFDLEGTALTSPMPFNTSADCSQNVILINFAP